MENEHIPALIDIISNFFGGNFYIHETFQLIDYKFKFLSNSVFTVLREQQKIDNNSHRYLWGHSDTTFLIF